MRFWKIQIPNYESDYQDTHINGHLEHLFNLPGVKCNVCNQTWGGSRVLPFECPPILQKNKNIKDSWPIPFKEHQALQKIMIGALKRQYLSIDINELFPGDTFQPCYLDVPTIPRFDFLWPSVGSLIVAERIKDIFNKYCSNNVASVQVILRKVGKREAKMPIRIPETGEPEDMIKDVPLLDNLSEVGPYFEICILKKSGWPIGREPKSICEGCKRLKIDTSIDKITMNSKIWNGDKIFFLASTLHIVITDEIKSILEELNPTNVIFTEI